MQLPWDVRDWVQSPVQSLVLPFWTSQLEPQAFYSLGYRLFWNGVPSDFAKNFSEELSKSSVIPQKKKVLVSNNGYLLIKFGKLFLFLLVSTAGFPGFSVAFRKVLHTELVPFSAFAYVLYYLLLFF